MDALLATDLASLAALCCFLAYFSVMDARYRSLPLYPTAMFAAAATASLAFRVALSDQATLFAVSVSLLLTGVVSMTMLVLVHMSKMVGIGDVVILLLSGLLCPYVPYPEGARLLPVLTPVSTAIASLLVYADMRRRTVRIDSFPPKFRRVRVHKAYEIKRSNPVKEYPVYVEGLGFVFDKVFASSPSENAARLLQSVPDDATVYTMPNFPFVCYLSLGYAIATVAIFVVQMVAQTALG